jgi:hypothetical protein
MHKGSEIGVRDVAKILHVAVFLDVCDDQSIAELAQPVLPTSALDFPLRFRYISPLIPTPDF